MWRFGYPNPVNYNDNELFCGGYAGSSANRDQLGESLENGRRCKNIPFYFGGIF